LNVVLHLSPQVIYIFNFIFFILTLYWLYLVLRKQENGLMAGTACLMLLLNFTTLSELNNIYHPTLALPFLNLCWVFTILSLNKPQQYLWPVFSIALFLTQLHLSFWLFLCVLTYFFRKDLKTLTNYQWGLLLLFGILFFGPAGYKLVQDHFYLEGYLNLIKSSPTIASSDYLENFNIFNYSRLVRLVGRMAQRILGIFVFEELRINQYLSFFVFLLWGIALSTLRINREKIKALRLEKNRLFELCLVFIFATIIIYFLSPKTITSFRRSSFLQMPLVYFLIYLFYYFSKSQKTLLFTISLIAVTNMATWSYCMDGRPCGTIFHRGMDYAVIKSLANIPALKKSPHTLFKLTELRRSEAGFFFFDGNQRFVGLDYFFTKDGTNPASKINPTCWTFIAEKDAPEKVVIDQMELTKIREEKNISLYQFNPLHNFCPYSFKNPYNFTVEQKRLAHLLPKNCLKKYCFEKTNKEVSYTDRLGRSFLMTFKPEKNSYIVDLVTINMEVYNALTESKFTDIIIKVNDKNYSFFPADRKLAKYTKQPFQIQVPRTNQSYTIEAIDSDKRVLSEIITL